ncbi:dihydrodipicolinate reductase-like protein CRR1, chloroplastic [Tanacetum coccineum]
MAALRIQIHAPKPMASFYLKIHYHTISCSMQQQPPQNNIKVVINGAAKEIGMVVVLAVTKAGGMEVAGAVDSYLVGEDIGNVRI